MAKSRFPFRILFFTQDYCYRREADDLNELVKLTGDNIHLYKPQADLNEVRRLLEQLAPETRSKIVLHHHRSLAEFFLVKGVHISTHEWTASPAHPKPDEGCQEASNKISNAVSMSIKTLTNKHAIDTEYAFFSPVFQSISKKNHHPKFTIEQINAWVATQTEPIIALGGLDATNIHQLTGFSGFAFKGAIWNAADPIATAHDLIKGIFHEC